MIAAVRLVMLTKVGLDADVHEAHQTGIVGYLSKPVRQSQLYDCLASADRSSIAKLSTPFDFCPNQQAAPPALQGRVLLAEDNPVNQEVAHGILEILGYRVDIVATGCEAIAALMHTEYDIVLMDCEMPEMNGLEATRTIRQQEAEGVTKRLPIIALTAHALQEHQEMCMQAGMDDYLSKPFSLEQLHTILARWLPRPAPYQEAGSDTGQCVSDVLGQRTTV
jgi:CheY-like chemotaxis protein